MPVSLPVTKYRPTNGLDEAGQSDLDEITTLSDSVITTLSGEEIIINDGDVTTFPSTLWVESDGS